MQLIFISLINFNVEMVVEKLPSAHTIEEERAEKLLCSRGKSFDNLPKDTQDLKQGL